MKKALFLLLTLCLVGTIAYADDTKAVLTIVYEARGESFDGQIAVASVIKTRMYIKNKTSYQIVTAPHQFSCWAAGTLKPTQKHVPTSSELETAWRAWQIARIGAFTNYYATSIKAPNWARERLHRRQIGRHIFCKLENF